MAALRIHNRAPRYALIAALVIALFLGAVAVARTFLNGPVFVPLSPASPRPQAAAVVLVSGDAGFKVGMGPAVAARLNHAGFPAVGVDSLVFFHHHRTPEEVGRLITAAARLALKGRPDAKLVLIGQSFGADLVPTAVAQLPADVRSRLRLVALVVPTLTVYYQVSPAEYFGFGKPDAQGTTLARRINNIRLLCIRGRDERMSLCPELAGMPNVTQIVLPGGHPLQRNADRLFDVLRRAIEADATSQLR